MRTLTAFRRRWNNKTEVKFWQAWLNAFAGEDLSVDGDYGLKTVAATKRFQAANGLDRRDDYTVASHSTVLDGFIRLARKEIKERRRSLSEEKSSPATMPETKTPKHKSHDMER